MTPTDRAIHLCAWRWWMLTTEAESWLAEGNRSRALRCVMLADMCRTAAERVWDARRGMGALVRATAAAGLYRAEWEGKL